MPARADRPTLFYDGECGFCRDAVAVLSRWDREGRIELIPFQDAARVARFGLPLPALAAAMHLVRSEEHTSELQSQSNLVCRLLLEKKKTSHFFDLVIVKILTSRLSLSKHLAQNLGNLLLLGKIGVFHNRRNASSRLLLLISKHLILCIYLVFRILA